MADNDQNKAAGSSYWDDIHRALSPRNEGEFLPKIELPWSAANELLGRWSWAFELAFVGTVTLLAFWLRFFDIASVPLGIHGDEALFGIDALNFISGEHRGMWNGSALGNPGGYAWLLALSFTIGETNVTWLRMVSVLSGTMLVPAAYMLVRQVISRDVALLSSIMIATSSWLIFQSRIAYQMIVVVFVITLSMYLLVEAVKRRDVVIAILGGLVFGAGLYTFKAYLIFFTAMTGLILLLTYLPTALRQRRETYVFLIGAFLIGAPLLIFYVESGFIVQNYTNFYVNSDSLSISDLLSRGVEVFFFAKNPIGDGGVDGAPSAPLLLNLFAQAAFFVGVATVILFIKHRPYQLVVLAFLVAMPAAVLTLDAESRRFLLGIMLLLIITAIGVRSLVIISWVVISKVLDDTETNVLKLHRVKDGGVFVAVAAVIVIPFLVLYFGNYPSMYPDWLNEADA